MPIAILFAALLSGALGLLAGLALGLGAVASVAIAPLAASAGAMALCAAVLRRPEETPRTPRGAASEPECIQAP